MSTVIGIRSGIVLLLLCSACAVPPAPSIPELYRQGYRQLEAGNLEAAAQTAARGSQQARAQQAKDWSRAFDVLGSEVLVGQRRIPAALVQLDRQLVANGDQDAIQVRAMMTRGYARCHSRQGPDAQASSDLQAATRLARRLQAGGLRAEVMLRRGACRALADDDTGAEALFLATAGLARQQGNRLLVAKALGNMGNLRVGASRYDDAVRWLTRSREAAAGLDAVGLSARNMGRLGWCYLQLGDYPRAVESLEEAEILTSRSGHLGDQMTVLQHLGFAYQQLAQYRKADNAYSRASDIARQLDDPRESARAQANLEFMRAALALTEGRIGDAASHADSALRVEVAQRLTEDRQRSLLLLGRIREHQQQPARAQALYREVLGMDSVRAELRWEAHALLARQLADAGQNEDADAEYRKAFALMDTALAQLLEPQHRLPFLASVARFQSDYIAFLVSQGRDEEALHMANGNRTNPLSPRMPRASPTTPPLPVDYRQLAARNNALLLFYATGPRQSHLWVISAQRTRLVALPGAATLAALVDSHQRRILSSRDPLAESASDSIELYRLLVLPGIGALPKGKRLVVAADGPLLRLNFETLVVPDPHPHYLIEDAIISSALALRQQPARADKPHAQRSLLVMGDPATTDPQFPRLPFAAAEMQAVAARFRRDHIRVRAGSDATPAAYIAAKPGLFDYIHIAAHAQANAIAPLDSAIVLSGQGGDYKLYARDLMQVPLHATLVSLSACRSAGARAFAGQGLVGLSWAFLGAGAKQVIGGLWQVEDRSTAELMTALYANLSNDSDPVSALRDAKLQLLHSNSAYRKPYYWAPFMVYSAGVVTVARVPP